MKKILFCPLIFLVFLLMPVLSPAYDWGLLLDQDTGLENADDLARGFSYSAALVPWFSAPLSEDAKLYLSAGISANYKNETWAFVPQLFRTDFTYRIGSGAQIRAGRMFYSDPLGFIASGLFDGLHFTLDSSLGVLGLGVWYTGFLYNKNAQITMTAGDLEVTNRDLDYSDFVNTYFAPRRLAAALDWDISELVNPLRLKFALIGQFDLTGNDDYLNSQYLAVKTGINAGDFILDLGISAALSQTPDYSSETKFGLGFAGELGAGWILPTPITDQLTFTGRFSSGTVDDSILTAFAPLTTASQGDILQAKLSGLSMLRLDYTARPISNLTFSIADSYFILSDLGTYSGYPGGRDGYFLGNEFFGRIIWSPVSDLRLTLGGGIFLPSMGNAAGSEDPQWRLELNAVLVLF